MKTSIKRHSSFGTIPADVVILPVFEAAWKQRSKNALLQKIEEQCDHCLETASEEGFQGKRDQIALLPTHGALHCKRLALVGLGDEATFVPETLRLAVGALVRSIGKLKASRFAIQLPHAASEDAWLIRSALEGLLLGAYRFEKWKSRAKGTGGRVLPKEATIFLAGEARPEAAHEQAATLAIAVADATNFARDLVNEPPGTMTPTILARRAQQMARQAKLPVELLGPKQIQDLRMGLFLGVTKGSVEEPRLVRITYRPTGAADRRKPPLCLVGKAITFDSGGLSIKPSDGMLDMKADMAGSAAVLGAMKVVADLKPPFPVVGYLGSCENMPSGNSYRLGDVLVSRLGKTVEITNTDAEGRLVLGDVLSWANESKPFAIIDLATLTGACVVALGNDIFGAFGDSDPLMYDVLEAARISGEEAWRLPLSPLFKSVLKSEVADLKNAGERWGGASSAALFLKEFVGATPWVHLDIAGPAFVHKERGYLTKGATGAGVRTLVELVRRLSRA